MEHRSAHEKTADKKLKIAIILTIIFFFVEFFGGLISNSLALISDSFHMFSDVLALFLTWFALRLSCKLPTDTKTFGYHRTEIFAAMINGFLLFLLAGCIIYEAIRRFLYPVPIRSSLMIAVACLGLLINLVVIFKLKDHKDLNIRSAFLHVVGDTASSVLIIIGGFVISFSGMYLIDPLLSLPIALLIGFWAFKLVNDSMHTLLEGVPKGVHIDEVIAEMNKVKNVKAVHAIHLWSICSNVNVLSAHVLVDEYKIANTSRIVADLNKRLEKFDIKHTTFQFECARCSMFWKLKEVKH